MPDPPALHLINWEETIIHVFISDSGIIGTLTANPQAKMANFVGWVVGMPVGFTSIKEF